MRLLLVLLLPLVTGCAVNRFETSAYYSSYTKSWSVPIYGPQGAAGDNEPEMDFTFLSGTGQGLDQSLRFSMGEGTLARSPQLKVSVYSATWAMRHTQELTAGLSWDVQLGPRVAYLTNEADGKFDVGPDVSTALSIDVSRNSTVGLGAGLWWTHGGSLPEDFHPRFGVVFGWSL